MSKFLDASIVLRQGAQMVPECPDIPFSINTYQKIAENETKIQLSDTQIGDKILLPINLFFETLEFDDHRELYDMYKLTQSYILAMTSDNRRDIQEKIQVKIFETMRRLELPRKMIEFCSTDKFVYPYLGDAGTLPHHSKEKTYLLEDYIEITAISLLSKLMVPIWGEFVKILSDVNIGPNQREKIAFDLIEPTLEESAFERIYSRLSYLVTSLVAENRKNIDKKPLNAATTSFILTHNGLDDQMFDATVMATIIVKRMATYECFTRLKDGNVANAMVYIDDGIRKTADTRIRTMRNKMTTMPRKPLPTYDTEDNSSILDHAARTSRKPIDVPILVTTAVTQWELPKLIEVTKTPRDVYDEACAFYSESTFDISPLTQALVASFVGNRFGGSKCLGYLPAPVYQKIVVVLQIFLVRQEMMDLATLITSRSSVVPIDGVSPAFSHRLKTMYNKSNEYLQCQTMFKGIMEKPVNTFGKKITRGKQDVEVIAFVRQIERMNEWLINYSHKENTAPVIWKLANELDPPVLGSECRFDEHVIKNLCAYYLMMHQGSDRPF
jgi:hypothetical protein